MLSAFLVASGYPSVLYLCKGRRDNPSTVVQRMVVVSLYTLSVLAYYYWHSPAVFAQFGLGINIVKCAKVLLLTTLPYIGTLWTVPIDFDELRGIHAVRNLVVGPATEELVYRGVLCGLYKYYGYTCGQTVVRTPLYFGVAHFHHAIEQLRNDLALSQVVSGCLLQFLITWLFGAYSAFIWFKYQSVWPPLFAHMFCNFMGPPRHFGMLGIATSALFFYCLYTMAV